MTDKIIKAIPVEPENLDDTEEVILRANDALAVHELRRILQRQAERDVVINEMREVIDSLSVGHSIAVEEINKLKRNHEVLVRQQLELYERQNIIAAVCDAFADKLEKEIEARQGLASECDAFADKLEEEIEARQILVSDINDKD